VLLRAENFGPLHPVFQGKPTMHAVIFGKAVARMCPTLARQLSGGLTLPIGPTLQERHALELGLEGFFSDSSHPIPKFSGGRGEAFFSPRKGSRSLARRRFRLPVLALAALARRKFAANKLLF
jgi:hypothetical protein